MAKKVNSNVKAIEKRVLEGGIRTAFRELSQMRAIRKEREARENLDEKEAKKKAKMDKDLKKALKNLKVKGE